MFLTAQLVFTIFMLAAEKHKSTFIAPIGIGLSLFIAELMGVYYTGGSLNPARSFGPSVVVHQFHSYHWIYWLGPILGALLASGFYMFIKALEYETVNPEQDAGEHTGRAFDPTTGQEKRVDSNLHTSRNGQLSAAAPTAPMIDTTNEDMNGYHRGPSTEAGTGSPTSSRKSGSAGQRAF